MRKISAFIGSILAAVIISLTFLKAGIELKFFINLLGLAIVIGGTLSAIFLSYSLSDVLRMISIVSRIFLRNDQSLRSVGNELMQFSDECSTRGIPAKAEGRVHPFLNDCLVLISDGYNDEDMREMLEQRIMASYELERYEMNIIRSMSKYPPAFGMIGTVVGLIALMASLGGESPDMAKIGSYMAVALTTTLYGLMIANFIFKPISDNLEIGTKDNMKRRQLILETAMLIKNKASLLVIQDTINSLIPPREAINYVGKGRAKAA